MQTIAVTFAINMFYNMFLIDKICHLSVLIAINVAMKYPQTFNIRFAN